MAEWDVSVLRFTAFPPAVNVTINPEQWWMTVAGEQPDRIVAEPKSAQYQFVGNYNEGQLSLNLNLSRLDWIWTTETNDISDVGVDGNLIPVLGSFKEKAAEFHHLLDGWYGMEDLPPANRVAFGAILVQPVEDRVSGYRVLQSYLHRVLQIEPENSSDLLYQINRPCEIVVGDQSLQMNRLSKWSVRATVRQQLQLSPHGAMYPLLQTQFAALLELDISTMPEAEVRFDGDMQKELYSKMIQLGFQVADEGDSLK